MLKSKNLLGGLCVFTMLALPSQAVLAQATNWDMATPYPSGIFHTKNISTFAEEVEEATDGALHIEVHPGGSLFEHAEIKNAVRSRLVPMGEFILSRLANENSVFELDSIPFLATSFEDAQKLWDVQQEAVKDILAEQNIMVLYTVPWPPQGIYTKEPLESIEDLSGLRFRTYSSATERFAQLADAVPTQVEVPDIGQAFSTGRVDGMITSAATGVNTKAWDYLDYYYNTQAFLPKNVIVVNKQIFDSLDKSTQQAVLDASERAEERGWEMAKTETEEMNKALAENGINVVTPSPELIEPLYEIGNVMAVEWAEQAGEVGQEIIDNYKN